jgi:hypothetical protein
MVGECDTHGMWRKRLMGKNLKTRRRWEHIIKIDDSVMDQRLFFLLVCLIMGKEFPISIEYEDVCLQRQSGFGRKEYCQSPAKNGTLSNVG